MSTERFFIALDALLLIIWEEHRIVLSPQVLFEVDRFMEQTVLLRPPATDDAFWLAAQMVVKYVVLLAGRRALARSEMLMLKACWRMQFRNMLVAAGLRRGADHVLP